VQRIGEIHSFLSQMKRRDDSRPVFHYDIREAYQLAQGGSHLACSGRVRAEQHPVGFEQHRLGNPYLATGKQIFRDSCLFGVVLP